MKKALINPHQICMTYDEPPVELGAYVVEVNDSDFPVAEPLFWKDCDDAIVAYQYYYNNNEYYKIPEAPPKSIPTSPPNVI